MATLHQLLKAVILKDASDLHVVSGTPPVMRISGRIVRVKMPVLTPKESRELCFSILTPYQRTQLEEHHEIDFSFVVKGLARFRANVFFQQGRVSGVFRKIPVEIPHYSQLGLPKSLVNLTQQAFGLVLVTGPTGSGKSTTLAALVDKINEERTGHVITLEDPIEFVHEHKNCIINQREIGIDSFSYKSAIKNLLRQDPDVVLIGELRDLSTIEAALTIAETGHLVLGTLHTNTAIQTVSRLVNVFPGEQQNRIRVLLSNVLQGVASQKLVPSRDGGRVLALEILVMSPNIRNLIREDKLHQVYGMMQVGQEKTGMMTLNQSLFQLVVRRKISVQAGLTNSPDPEELTQMLSKAGV